MVFDCCKTKIQNHPSKEMLFFDSLTYLKKDKSSILVLVILMLPIDQNCYGEHEIIR